jgi:glucose-6-phosphate isomerase
MNKNRLEILYSNSACRGQQNKDAPQRELSERVLQENEDLLQAYVEHCEAVDSESVRAERFRRRVRQLLAESKLKEAIYELSVHADANPHVYQEVLEVSHALMCLEWGEISGTSISNNRIEKNQVKEKVLKILNLKNDNAKNDHTILCADRIR